MKWKKFRLLLLATGVLLGIARLWFVYTIEKVSDDMCGNQVLSEIPSPDQVYRVVTFQRDCGATTGFSTQVSVLKYAEKLPNESGNLFVADTDHGKAPSGIGGGPEVKISWVGSRSLLLIHHRDVRIFFATSYVYDVFAEYKAIE